MKIFRIHSKRQGQITEILRPVTTTHITNPLPVIKLNPVLLSSSAKLLIRGSLSKNLNAVSLSSTALSLALGNGFVSKSLNSLTLSSQAKLLIKSSLNKSLASLSLSSQARLILKASLNKVLGASLLSSTGSLSILHDTRFGTSTDTNGWITHQYTGRLVFCNSARPDDSGNGLSAATAKKTMDAALTVFNSGYTAGDKLLLAEGGTYSDDGLHLAFPASGASLANMTAVVSYDPADPSNTAKYGRALGANRPRITHAYASSAYGASCFTPNPAVLTNYIAMQGLEFIGTPTLVAPGDTITSGISIIHANSTGYCIQNCLFNKSGVTIQPDQSATTANWGDKFLISKCTGYGQWRSNGNNSFIFAEGVQNLIVEDCAFIHNGWQMGAARGDGGSTALAAGGAYHLGHGIYISAYTSGSVVRRCVGIDPAQDAWSFRGPFTASCLVSLDSPIFMTFIGYSGSVAEAPNGGVGILHDFVNMGGTDINSTEPRGDGFGIRDAVSPSVIQNGAMFDSPKFGSGTDSIESIANDLATGLFANVSIDTLRAYQYAATLEGSRLGTNSGQITLTWSNCIMDVLAPGGTNSTYSSAPTGYKTRDQVVTQVLTDMGVTPGASYTLRKAQLVNYLIEYPDLAGQVALAIDTLGLQSLGLSPITHPVTTAPSISGLTAPRSVY